MTEDRAARTSRARIRELERRARALDPSREDRTHLLERVDAFAQGLLDSLDQRPAYRHDKSAARRLRALTPENGVRGIDEILESVDESIVQPGLLPAHPGHLAYIPGGGLYASALGDYVADVTNDYVGVWFTGPGAVEVENLVLRWMARLIGYPETFAGNLASGGSLASLIAVVTARECAGLTASEFGKAVVYSTSHAHHCLDRALHVAGLGDAVRREVPMDDRYRMCPSGLRQQVEADREAGLRPWVLMGSAGTTDTGAVDPLSALADVAEEESLWFHVDAAYGGFFALLDSCRELLAGLDRADSLVLDPHKGLFLPYGTGAVLVRDGKALAEAHSYQANYLRDMAEVERVRRSPAALSPELSRNFRGLRVWFPLLLHGEDAFRSCLAEKRELALYFWREARRLGFEVGPEPDLSVVFYRWVPEDGDADEFNRQLIEEVHRDGRVFLSSTFVDGKLMLRMAILAFRTHLDTIDLALEVLGECVERVERAEIVRGRSDT